ncbi:MAG: DNA-directed RNA polymerase subunit E' [archaeon GW2011_AR5]|nr:MAG: DNA-directed RNA polymerase subunit E' [archaeon GW2011_AR5]
MRNIVKRACRQCKRILKGTTCPVCKTSNITTSFQGTIVIFDVNSDVAKKLGVTAPGKYAIKV